MALDVIFSPGEHRAATVTVQNTGTERLAGALLMTLTAPSGHVDHGTLPVDGIPAGQAQTFVFTFTPAELGTYSWLVILNDTLGNELNRKPGTLEIGAAAGAPVGILGLLAAVALGIAMTAKKI